MDPNLLKQTITWDYPMLQLSSTGDRLIQFKILHRIYFTLQRLPWIFPEQHFRCWRCSEDLATFILVFLHCPVIWSFWEVSQCICSTITMLVPLTTDVCILGLVHLLASTRAMRTLLGLLLFYARKAILLGWKFPSAPTLNFWKHLVMTEVFADIFQLLKPLPNTNPCHPIK